MKIEINLKYKRIIKILSLLKKIFKFKIIYKTGWIKRPVCICKECQNDWVLIQKDRSPGMTTKIINKINRSKT